MNDTFSDMKVFKNIRATSKRFKKKNKRIKLNKIKFNIRNNIASPILRHNFNQSKFRHHKVLDDKKEKKEKIGKKEKIRRKMRKTIVASPEVRRRIVSVSPTATPGALSKKMRLKTMARG